jgi:hypothetical protein
VSERNGKFGGRKMRKERKMLFLYKSEWVFIEIEVIIG